MANAKTGIAKVDAKNEVAQSSQVTGLKLLLSKMQGQIAKALPSVLTPERYTRMVMTALSTNPDLQKCTPESFLGAVMQAAQLGVEPNTPLGQAYLIPYRNKGRLECQFILGYKSFLDLAYRSGEVSIIDAQAVHANDEFEYEYGLEPKLKFKPALKNRGEVIAYYAMFKTKAGGFNFLVMSKEDIVAHAKMYSKAYSNGYSPWSTNFDAMAKKTVLKQVLKYAPLKSEFVKNLAADETIKTDIQPDMVDVNDETEPINVTPVEEEHKKEELPDGMQEPEIVPFGDED
jgi:recombination protein RecT